MPHIIGRFSSCAGFDSVCPWKQAFGLNLDLESGRQCPLCGAESLRAALQSRGGQDLTVGLLRLKNTDQAAYQLALRRLDRFHGADLMNTYQSRVERAEKLVSVWRSCVVRQPMLARAALMVFPMISRLQTAPEALSSLGLFEFFESFQILCSASGGATGTESALFGLPCAHRV